MCVWRRVHRLGRTIADLERQQGVEASLHLWVNAPEATAEVARIVRGSRLDIDVTVSPENVGGFGRFELARRLAAHPYVVFVDDDQVLGETMLETFAREAAPRTVCAWWSYAFDDGADYWRRSRVEPGAPADYCGTGGMVVDTSIFGDDLLFACPPRFRFVEDLWLSYVASARGWTLLASAAPLAIEEDGRDQYLALADRKSELLRHLVHERGWVPPSARPLRAARSFTALADAGELIARPELLAAWAARFGNGNDATLVIATSEAQATALERAVEDAGIGADGPDLLAVTPDADEVRRLAARVDALYGTRPPSAAGVPRYDADSPPRRARRAA